MRLADILARTILATGLIAGVAGAAPAPAAAADPEVVTFSGAGPSGRWFALASLYSKILDQAIPGTTFNGVTGKGISIGNLKRVNAGKVEAGFVHFYHLGFARNHQAMFADDDTTYDKVLVWFDMAENFIRVIADTKYKRIGDLKGATISIGVRGSGDDEQCKLLLGAHGVTEENSSFQYTSRNDATAALAARQIDALCNSFTRNNRGHLQELLSARALGEEVDFLPPDEDAAKALVEKYPHFFIDREGEPVFDRPNLMGLGYKQGAVVNADLSDDLVYRMTKALFEHWGDVQEAAPYMKEHSGVDRAVEITFLPYHPGAIRYYKEVGAWQKVHKD